MEPDQTPEKDQTPASEQTPASDDGLQFDRVEAADSGAAAAVACTACQKPVSGYYYQVNDAVVCVPCRESLAAALTGGSGFLRLIKGALFGFIAAALGSGLYFAILELTGYQFALIAIVVGVMVGVAVQAGSERRGGWIYQLMAVLLTYVAIVTTYVPMVYGEMEKQAIVHARERLATAPAQAEADMAALVVVNKNEIVLTPVHKGMLVIVSFILAFISPFLAFDPIMYIIIGVGLYEAWKLTRRVRLKVAGPFVVGAPAVQGPADMVATA